MKVDNAEVVVSKKYAQAFLNSYTSIISYDDIKHIEQIGSAIKHNKLMTALLKVPSMEDKELQSMIVERIKNFGFPASMNKVVDLLAQTQRLFLLPAICHWIAVYFRERQRIIQFLVTSSQPLSNIDKEVVGQFLKNNTQSFIESLYQIDRELIAGLRMQSETYLWEKSIAQKLRDVQLKNMR